ncbi:hypothetical protein PG988_002332 [Apiospora saccharicola]
MFGPGLFTSRPLYRSLTRSRLSHNQLNSAFFKTKARSRQFKHGRAPREPGGPVPILGGKHHEDLIKSYKWRFGIAMRKVLLLSRYFGPDQDPVAAEKLQYRALVVLIANFVRDKDDIFKIRRFPVPDKGTPREYLSPGNDALKTAAFNMHQEYTCYLYRFPDPAEDGISVKADMWFIFGLWRTDEAKYPSVPDPLIYKRAITKTNPEDNEQYRLFRAFRDYLVDKRSLLFFPMAGACMRAVVVTACPGYFASTYANSSGESEDVLVGWFGNGDGGKERADNEQKK